MWFRILDKIIDLGKTALEKLWNKWIGDNSHVGLAAQQRLPSLANRAVLVADFPVDICIGVNAHFAQLVLVPQRRNTSLVPVADALALEIGNGFDSRRADQGATKLVAPAADDSKLIVTQGALRKRRAHVHVGNDVDVE